MSIRVVCKDGLTYVGDLDRHRSNEYRIYLLGHQHCIWKSAMNDVFVFRRKKWHRILGYVCAYDTYIAAGGDKWPAEYANDI